MASFQVNNLFDVKDKVVSIIGGSRGIGKMIATGFIKNSAKVYILSRSTKDCAATEKELNELGPGTCVAIPADMQKLKQIDYYLVAELSKCKKALHVLVNNAGAAWGDSVDDYPHSAWTKLLTLNLQRVFNLTQKCLPLLCAKAEQGGREDGTWRDAMRIINLGSAEALTVPANETYTYSVSQAGLHHLSRNRAGWLGFEGMTSNTLVCGPFQSKMMAQTLREQGEIIRARISLGRIGTPEDVAGACIFLASRAGAFINGATIAMDGGSIVRMDVMALKL